VERHALNTVFRLSGEGATSYAPWTGDATGRASLALVDGESYEAVMDLASPANDSLKLIWIGPHAPANAWCSFSRPLAWPEIVQAMDALFAPTPDLDFDTGMDVHVEADNDGDTRPPDTVPAVAEPARRALIAAASPDQRLYLRARLALTGLTQADEAASGPDALALLASGPYAVLLLDFSLPGSDGWALLEACRQAKPPVNHLIAIKPGATLGERMRAWFAGIQLFGEPPEPAKLRRLLQKV